MADKMTKRELFNSLLAVPEVAANEAFVLGLEHELELLDRKAKSSKSESKITDEFKTMVYEALAKYECSSIKDLIANEFPNNGYTSQKFVPVLKALTKDGKVVRYMEKKTAMFKVVG